jgi:hypothetical protein
VGEALEELVHQLEGVLFDCLLQFLSYVCCIYYVELFGRRNTIFEYGAFLDFQGAFIIIYGFGLKEDDLDLIIETFWAELFICILVLLVQLLE